jgi:hypothetical protein
MGEHSATIHAAQCSSTSRYQRTVTRQVNATWSSTLAIVLPEPREHRSRGTVAAANTQLFASEGRS